MAEFIVAIELGSSKMTGIAGKKNIDGSITVLAVVSENSTACIRRGVVYNIEKTGQCLTNIVKKLKTMLKTEINQVYVGVSGQSIRSVKNVINKDLPGSTIVTQEMINVLMDTNRSMNYPDHEILDAATQEYKVDNQYQLDPVGIPCSRLEGNFLNILWKKDFYRRLNKCFENADISIAEMALSPLALADSVLTENEKRSGCILVDLGYETTTVSIYFKNILRHLAVIPLGSNNITKDITTLQMEDAEAEKMKLKYASAYTENCDIDNTLSYPIDHERSVDSRRFVEIVEARVQEIVENVWYQVPSEYTDKIIGGLVITGGGCNMPNIDVAFRNITHIEKIRIAKSVSQIINSNDPAITNQTGMMNTALALLAKGDINCAGEPLKEDLFAGHPQQHPQNGAGNDIHKGPQPNGSGKVMTLAEKQKAEEEARKRREAEEAEARRKAEEEAARIAREKKENSFTHRFWKGIKNFTKDMISEDE